MSEIAKKINYSSYSFTTTIKNNCGKWDIKTTAGDAEVISYVSLNATTDIIFAECGRQCKHIHDKINSPLNANS